MISMPRHYKGACGLVVICGLKLSLVIVLEAKYGQMENTAITVSQGSTLLHFLTFHTLDKAEFVCAHRGERGPHVPLPVLVE